jgi:hypothetical protein
MIKFLPVRMAAHFVGTSPIQVLPELTLLKYVTFMRTATLGVKLFSWVEKKRWVNPPFLIFEILFLL